MKQAMVDKAKQKTEAMLVLCPVCVRPLVCLDHDCSITPHNSRLALHRGGMVQTAVWGALHGVRVRVLDGFLSVEAYLRDQSKVPFTKAPDGSRRRMFFVPGISTCRTEGHDVCHRSVQTACGIVGFCCTNGKCTCRFGIPSAPIPKEGASFYDFTNGLPQGDSGQRTSRVEIQQRPRSLATRAAWCLWSTSNNALRLCRALDFGLYAYIKSCPWFGAEYMGLYAMCPLSLPRPG